jgi:hypothetical protein
MTEQKRKGGDRPAFRIHPDQLTDIGPRSGEPDDAPDFQIPEAPPEPTGVAVVARGHCVHVPDGTRHISGFDVDRRRNVYRQGFIERREGEQVTLYLSEIKRLREIGFLVDPNKQIAADEKTISALPRDATMPGPVGPTSNGKAH